MINKNYEAHCLVLRWPSIHECGFYCCYCILHTALYLNLTFSVRPKGAG